MIRTTEDAVWALVEEDATISMTPFIEAASALVTVNCEDKCDDYTATDLELIERWLAAWAYKIRDRLRTADKAGDVSASYQHVEDLGFDCNEWGQMAMRLDWNGGLAALNSQTKEGTLTRVAGVTWLGKRRHHHV